MSDTFKRMTIEDTVVFHEEDSGAALISEALCADDSPSGIYVRVCSWEESPLLGNHEEARKLEGKKVRVTIEVIE